MWPCRQLSVRFVCLLCVAAGLAGCGEKTTPEQLRADAALREANAVLARGDSHAGRRALLTAFSLDVALDRKQKIAEEAQMLGILSATSADFDSAFDWYARSIEHYRAIGDRSSARSMTLAAAGLHRRMGNERHAFAMYSEALRLARIFHDDDGARDIQWAMLPCARALDETEEEGKILRELLGDYTAAGNLAKQGAALLESGIGKSGVRSFDRAVEDFLRALMLGEQPRDSLLTVRASLRLAMTFEASGRAAEALASYGDCLKHAGRMRGAAALRMETLIRIGNLYLRNRKFDDAKRFFSAASASARTLGNTVAEGYLRLQLGNCKVESEKDSAFKDYRAALDSFRSLGYPPGIAYATLCLGYLFERNNQPTDALKYFKLSIEQSEAVTAPRAADDLYLSCEQAYFGTRQTPSYDETIDILLQLGRYDEAFWYVDRRNNRDLFGALGEMVIDSGNDSLHAQLHAYTLARARHIGAQRQFLELAAEGGARRDLLGDVRASRDRAYAVVNEIASATAKVRRALEPFVRVSSVSVSEVQKVLPPGTALVFHILARRALYAFVVTNTRSSVQVAAFDRDRVFDLAREYVDLLALRDSFADSSRTQQVAIEQRLREVNGPLYQAFIRPIENAISDMPSILVILPRELPWFPLHTVNRGVLPGTGFLAEQHSISYLPSAASVLLQKTQQRPVKDVVALGYAGGGEWDVEYELRDVRAFYKEVRLFFNQQASLPTLQKEHADVLHIAARFHYNEERPGNSYVLLADPVSADITKRVPTDELMSIPASTTVVVSDLDPARLGVRPAEPYLFLANGTQEVVFTSRVPSRKAKKVFGEIFYTALLTGANSRAAFHKAQLDMIKMPEFAGPYAWAWFTLWGM